MKNNMRRAMRRKAMLHNKPSRIFSVSEDDLLAFIVEKARENKYNPDEDSILIYFRKRIREFLK